MKNKTQFYYYRESLLQSVLSDIMTFGFIFGMFFANAIYFGGKWYIYVFSMFLMFVQSYGRATGRAKVFTSKKELQDFVNNL